MISKAENENSIPSAAPHFFSELQSSIPGLKWTEWNPYVLNEAPFKNAQGIQG